MMTDAITPFERTHTLYQINLVARIVKWYRRIETALLFITFTFLMYEVFIVLTDQIIAGKL